VHVGQPELSALELEGESSVVEAQQVKDGGLKVVEVDRVFDHMETQFISPAQCQPRLYAAAGLQTVKACG
jgi:hypothetical protein